MPVLLLLCVAATAELRVDVSPRVVSFGESLKLVISNNVDERPDISVLARDFDIIDSGSGRNVQWINGQVSRSYSWTFQLQPKRSGTLEIPAFKAGNKHSLPLKISVNKPDLQSDDVLIVSGVDRRQQYVGGQIIYSIKLLYRSWINGHIQPPKVADFRLTTIAQNKRYRTLHNNTHYEAIEWRYALSASKSGTFHLPPAIFQGQVLRNGRHVGVRLQSEVKEVVVVPQPTNWPVNEPWLPAESVKLWEVWEPRHPHWQVGQNVVREVHLEVEGVMPEQLASLEWKAPPQVKMYPQQPQRSADHHESGLRSRLVQKWVIIPEGEGDLDLGVISVSWWDTKQGKLRKAVLSPRQVEVTAGKTSLQSSPPAVIGDVSVVASGQPPDQEAENTAFRWWFWLLALSGWAGWGVVAWLLLRRPKDSPPPLPDDELQALRAAIDSGQQREAYHLALRWWHKNSRTVAPMQGEKIRAALDSFGAAIVQKRECGTDELIALITQAQARPKGGRATVPPLYAS